MISINIYYDTYEVHNPCYPSQNNQVIKVIVQVDSVVSLINDGPNGWKWDTDINMYTGVQNNEVHVLHTCTKLDKLLSYFHNNHTSRHGHKSFQKNEKKYVFCQEWKLKYKVIFVYIQPLLNVLEDKKWVPFLASGPRSPFPYTIGPPVAGRVTCKARPLIFDTNWILLPVTKLFWNMEW